MRARVNEITMPREGAAYAQRGFTLLELMVVMAIIVILMTIATAKFEQMVVKAREATLRPI